MQSIPVYLLAALASMCLFRCSGRPAAPEDLARAISFVFANAEGLGVSTDCYPLWGGSAGAQMAAYLGSLGPAAFWEKQINR